MFASWTFSRSFRNCRWTCRRGPMDSVFPSVLNPCHRYLCPVAPRSSQFPGSHQLGTCALAPEVRNRQYLPPHRPRKNPNASQSNPLLSSKRHPQRPQRVKMNIPGKCELNPFCSLNLITTIRPASPRGRAQILGASAAQMGQSRAPPAPEIAILQSGSGSHSSAPGSPEGPTAAGSAAGSPSESGPDQSVITFKFLLDSPFD